MEGRTAEMGKADKKLADCLKRLPVPAVLSLLISLASLAAGFCVSREICLFLMLAAFLMGAFGSAAVLEKGYRIRAFFHALFYSGLYLLSAVCVILGMGLPAAVLPVLFFCLELCFHRLKGLLGPCLAAALYSCMSAGFGTATDLSFICFILMYLCIFGAAKTFKGRVWLYAAVMAVLWVLRLSNRLFFACRFEYIGWRDLVSVGTLFDVASGYSRAPEVPALYLSGTAVFLIAAGVVSGLVCRPENIRGGIVPARIIGRRAGCVLALCLYFLAGCAALHCFHENGRTILDTEMIAASLAEDIRFSLLPCGPERYRETLASFSPDPPCEDSPHIILVLGESMGDTKKSFDVKYDRDPLEPLRNLNEVGVRMGTVGVSVYGGGTSVSEWEVLTGLSAKRAGLIGSPFITMRNNPSFLCDGVYGGYKKVLAHTGVSSSYKRDSVYGRLGFTERFFSDDMSKQYGSPSAFRSDRDLYAFIAGLTDSAEGPLFIKAITLECHGLYGYEPVGGVTVHEASGLADVQTFASIELDAAEAFAGLVGHYETAKDEKVLIVFFGDHNPTLSAEKKDVYITPYLVYSNFCELEEMPGELPLGKLLPAAKKAAGLPLGSWEKYILSLDDVPDEEMTAARIRFGGIEGDGDTP